MTEFIVTCHNFNLHNKEVTVKPVKSMLKEYAKEYADCKKVPTFFKVFERDEDDEK